MSELIAPNDVIEAWDRLARTPDGLLIYRHLQFIALGTERAGNVERLTSWPALKAASSS